MKNKVLKITNKDITSYLSSEMRKNLLISFVTNDTQALVREIPSWSESARVLGYLDTLVRFNDLEKEVFYEQSFFAGRGELVGMCKICDEPLYSAIKGFKSIRNQLASGIHFEQMRNDRTFLALFVSLKTTQKEFYREDKAEWTKMVLDNLEKRKESGRLSREDRETLGYLSSLYK